jgi:hypothetical protein
MYSKLWDLKNSIVEPLLLCGNRPCVEFLVGRLGLSICGGGRQELAPSRPQPPTGGTDGIQPAAGSLADDPRVGAAPPTRVRERWCWVWCACRSAGSNIPAAQGIPRTHGVLGHRARENGIEPSGKPRRKTPAAYPPSARLGASQACLGDRAKALQTRCSTLRA